MLTSASLPSGTRNNMGLDIEDVAVPLATGVHADDKHPGGAVIRQDSCLTHHLGCLADWIHLMAV